MLGTVAIVESNRRSVLLVGGALGLAMVASLTSLPLLDGDGFASPGSDWAWLDPGAFDDYLEFWEGWLVHGALLGALAVMGSSVAARASARFVPAFRVTALAAALLTYGAVLANFHRDLSLFFERIALGGVLLLVLPVGLIGCALKLGAPDIYR